jgi:hypothetical protein
MQFSIPLYLAVFKYWTLLNYGIRMVDFDYLQFILFYKFILEERYIIFFCLHNYILSSGLVTENSFLKINKWKTLSSNSNFYKYNEMSQPWVFFLTTKSLNYIITQNSCNTRRYTIKDTATRLRTSHPS